MSIFTSAVDGAPVKDVPRVLVCGECGCSSGDVLWQTVVVHNEVLGMVGFANCSRCGCTISGILAQDPSSMDQLRTMVEASLRDS